MTSPEVGKSLIAKQHAGLCKFSPNGKLFACVSGGDRNRLIIRSVFDLSTVQIFPCSSTISTIEWSPDSEYILCGLYKIARVQVFSLLDPDKYSCRINEGVAGLVYAFWAPDSRQILTVADFQLHITIWNLHDMSENVIKNPKLAANGISFSADERFLAIAHRKECKDFIGVYAIQAAWQRVKYFLSASVDLEEIVWSPNDDCIVVKDSSIEYLILVYSPTGNLIARYQAYERALGLKTCSFSPNGKFFAAGSFDEMCRVLNTISWKPTFECEHKPSTVPTRLTIEDKKENYKTDDNTSQPTAKTVKVVQPDLTKTTPRVGVGMLVWSSESEYLATRNDNMPNTLWIWSPTSIKPVEVIEFETSICSFKWDPARPRLAIAIGDRSIATWSKQHGVSMLNVDNDEWQESVKGIRWNSTGQSILLVSKSNLLHVTL